MTKTVLQWMRAGAHTFGAHPQGGEVPQLPPPCSKSPCCRLPLVKIPLGANEIDHYRCSECSLLYVWTGDKWALCELQDKHRFQSRAKVRLAHA